MNYQQMSLQLLIVLIKVYLCQSTQTSINEAILSILRQIASKILETFITHLHDDNNGQSEYEIRCR
ncbi:hypothetical protein DERP_007680 [Dermatophagoides pteronyssinus]|uniref:Secreted protein n=1 Tax=Dermatophagoides pteronyssinus TaxID=6956 RepID=A0ABQ8JL89_DERPT|nr:hypothetical protein DERP_007680 [Dermatophagoides pteronyssinus]